MEEEKVKEAQKVEKTEEVVKTKIGTAGLVLGIIAICTSIIPIINNLSFILGILALIFGIIAVIKDIKKVKAIITIILAVFAMVITINMQEAFVKSIDEAFNGSEYQKKEESNQTTVNKEDNKEVSKKTEFKVGEVAENDSLKIKFLSQNLDFKNYSKYADVKSGYKVLKAEFEFENKSSSDHHVSEWDFNCYADGYDCETFYSVDESMLSSTLSSGKKVKGSVYYEIPVNAKEIVLEYSSNVWTNEKAIFKVK